MRIFVTVIELYVGKRHVVLYICLFTYFVTFLLKYYGFFVTYKTMNAISKLNKRKGVKVIINVLQNRKKF